MAPWVLAVIAAVGLASACAGTGEEPAWSVAVTVRDGAPIAGSDGRLVTTDPGAGCGEGLATPVAAAALAGAAGTALSLDLEVHPCPDAGAADAASAPAPAGPSAAPSPGAGLPVAGGVCRWQMAPRPDACPARVTGPSVAGEAAWESEVTTLELELPGRTGIYELSLSCEVDGGEPLLEPVRAPVYVTYGEPLPIVSPPRRDWYERAASWSCGFEPEAPERDVLEAMLGSLYDYGREHWRYGSFDPSTVTDSPFEPYSEGAGWYSCPWEALVAAPNSCNFADCFEYSQVFEHMAATTGIGVFAPVADVGQGGGGFATHSDARSLDPEFTGNIQCPDGVECPAYLFSSHSLRFRDGLFYDSTFNRIYDSAGQFIVSDVLHEAGTLVSLPATGLRLRRADRMYGAWDRYELVSADSPPLLPLRPPPAETSFARIESPSVTVTELGLVAAANVSLREEGTFVVRALLAPGGDAAATPGEQAWLHASPAGSPALSTVVLRGPTEEPVPVSMNFAYAALQRAGGAGRHAYRIEVIRVAETPQGPDDITWVGGYTRVTEEDLNSVRGRPEITGLRVSRRRTADGGPDTDDLVATVTVATSRAGPHVLQARLAIGLTTLHYAGTRDQLETGTGEMGLTVPWSVLPAGPDASIVALSVELVEQRDEQHWEDSVAFQRFHLRVADGEVSVDPLVEGTGVDGTR